MVAGRVWTNPGSTIGHVRPSLSLYKIIGEPKILYKYTLVRVPKGFDLYSLKLICHFVSSS